jgi:hypothetical protein
VREPAVLRGRVCILVGRREKAPEVGLVGIALQQRDELADHGRDERALGRR